MTHKQGEMTPKFYLPYKYDYVENIYFTAPFPFALILGILEALRVLFCTLWKPVIHNSRAAYLQGFNDAQNNGDQ